jgi:hypothetical protein
LFLRAFFSLKEGVKREEMKKYLFFLILILFLFSVSSANAIGTHFTLSRWWRSTSWSWNNSKITSGDFSGDGIDDIAILYKYGSTDTGLWVFESNGSSFPTRRRWWRSTSWSWNNSKITSGDYNGDGKTDIAIFYKYGSTSSKMWVFTSTGSSFNYRVWWAPSSWSWDKSKITSGDFNGDGKTDIAIFYKYSSTSCRMWVLKSTGSSFIHQSWWTPSSWSWDSSKITSGNYNGSTTDDKDDIAIFYKYGSTSSKMWVLKSTGSSFVHQSWWSSSSWSWDKSKLISGNIMGNLFLDDIAILYDYGNSTTGLWVFASDGYDQFYPSKWWQSGSGAWSWSNSKLASGDFYHKSVEHYMDDIAILYKYGSTDTGLWVFAQYATAGYYVSAYEASGIYWGVASWNYVMKSPKIHPGSYKVNSIFATRYDKSNWNEIGWYKYGYWSDRYHFAAWVKEGEYDNRDLGVATPGTNHYYVIKRNSSTSEWEFYIDGSLKHVLYNPSITSAQLLASAEIHNPEDSNYGHWWALQCYDENTGWWYNWTDLQKYEDDPEDHYIFYKVSDTEFYSKHK